MYLMYLFLIEPCPVINAQIIQNVKFSPFIVVLSFGNSFYQSLFQKMTTVRFEDTNNHIFILRF